MEDQDAKPQPKGDSEGLPVQKSRRLLSMAASHKVVSYAHMDLVLWRNLPRELVVLVLARLPVPKITRLCCQLSKEWTMSMEFNRACDEVNPKMVTLLSKTNYTHEFLVRIFDFNRYIWLYVYRFRLTNQGILKVWEPMAADGGLVCFVSTWRNTKANPLCIVVINLLTRVQHELPPLQHVYLVPPTLVHMKVDSNIKGYKVVVICILKGCQTVETYDSFSRQWSKVSPSWGLIWGIAYKWEILGGNCFCWDSSSPCAYDLQKGQLELLDCDLLFQSKGACVVHYVHAGDRMFVLHEKLNGYDIGSGLYFITEFQSQNNVEVWVLVKTHGQCIELLGYPFHLHASEDVLMLHNCLYNTVKICGVLDFSTAKWHDLPENQREGQYVHLMCRVFWNAIP